MMGMLAGVGLEVVLAIVLGLGATALARHLHQTRRGWRSQGRSLRVLETQSLAQNRAVHLIAVGRRALLVSSTPEQISLLSDVTGEVELPVEETKTAPVYPFSALLTRFLSLRMPRPAELSALPLETSGETER